MIEFLPETNGSLIALKATGTISLDDIEGVQARFDQTLSRAASYRVFVDWCGLEGWAEGVRTQQTWYALLHRAMVNRAAIVADQRWQDDVDRLTDLLRNAMVRRFPPANRDTALSCVQAEA